MPTFRNVTISRDVNEIFLKKKPITDVCKNFPPYLEHNKHMERPIRHNCGGKTQGSFKKQLDSVLKKWNT